MVPSTHLLVRRCVQQLIREEPRQGETQLPCLHLSACELSASIFAHIHKSSRSARQNTQHNALLPMQEPLTSYVCLLSLHLATLHIQGIPLSIIVILTPLEAIYTTLMSFSTIPSLAPHKSLHLAACSVEAETVIHLSPVAYMFF